MSGPSAGSAGTSGDKTELTDRNAIFDALADEARCRAVEYLAERPGTVTLDQVVSSVVPTRTAGEGTPERRERVAIRFHHVHLPKMEAAGLLDYDRDGRLVEPTETIDVALKLRGRVADSRTQ